MNFGEAIAELKAGNAVCRTGWNGKGMWIWYADASKLSPDDLPFIEMKTAQGKYVPWVASQSDILAEDWIIFKENHNNE